MKPTAAATLASIDMNLLRVLDVLMQERKVAPAAARLGLSQPAVSNALARLRTALGDELLTRSPQGMQPTAYALSVHATLAPSLAAINASLKTKDTFNPLTAQWSARLAMTDIGEIVFLPPLLAHLQRAAPGLTVSTVQSAPAGLNAAMAEGAIDLALGWLPDVPQGFYQRRLFKQRYVCLMRSGHPLAKAKAKLTVEQFLNAEHVAIDAQGTGHAKADARLQALSSKRPAKEAAGTSQMAVKSLGNGKVTNDKFTNATATATATAMSLQRTVAVRVPSFLSVPYLLATSDLIATVPERLAQQACQPFGLVALKHPVAVPEFEVKMFWHRRVHQDAASQWLREWLAEEFTVR
jgi:DNA-binding transcriptional LysR family regulator